MGLCLLLFICILCCICGGSKKSTNNKNVDPNQPGRGNQSRSDSLVDDDEPLLPKRQLEKDPPRKPHMGVNVFPPGRLKKGEKPEVVDYSATGQASLAAQRQQMGAGSEYGNGKGQMGVNVYPNARPRADNDL